ncbi:hypothetical protein LDO48_00965 [Pantoea agglomerans]|nr:hypothetical protein [Pantoea agglomerans]
MSEWWERWWQMAAIARYGLLAALLSGLLLLFWILWLRPQQQALIAEQHTLLQLTRTLQLRQHQWRQNPDNAQLQAQLQSIQIARSASASGRAVEEILAARRSQLEEWQPDAPLTHADAASAVAGVPVAFCRAGPGLRTVSGAFPAAGAAAVPGGSTLAGT